MKPKRPCRMKIGAHWYRIEWMPEEKIDGKYVGLCLHRKKVLRIAAELPLRMVVQTLIHEAMHAIYYEYGLTNSEQAPDDYAAGMCSEENAVNVLSLGLATILTDNPDVRRYIMWALR